MIKYTDKRLREQSENAPCRKSIGYKCNKKINKRLEWFSNSPSSYICAGKCWHHGYFSGKIKFKPLDNGKYYVVKTIKPIDKNGVEAIKQKQTEIRERRKEKRHTRATR